MGLDMYLDRIHRDAVGYKDFDLDDIKKRNPALYLKLSQYSHDRGTPGIYQWESLWEEVGYWRKANAIHQWFVKNVQDECDNCGDYEVSKEQLTDILEVARKVYESCKLIDDTIKNGYTFKDGKMEPILEKGKIVEDPSVAQELLPTTDGFFFGSTDYDEYYVNDIKYTIETVEKALGETDFDHYAVYYRSSW